MRPNRNQVFLSHQMSPERDHIFISYATEQSALSDWLARRLAAEGYAVWYDRLKLLGGENWPKDIDLAIKNRTFRMLALLSEASMAKPNPTGEWLKGRAIGDKLGIEDFVIPLNTEGLKPHEITWNLQTTNYIQFFPSWSDGLTALLNKLASIEAPNVLAEGPRLAIKSTNSRNIVKEESEKLLSNCFRILQMPRYVSTFIVTTGLPSYSEQHGMMKQWAYWWASSYRILAFHDPPQTLRDDRHFQRARQEDRVEAGAADYVDPIDLSVALVRRSIDCLLARKGFIRPNNAKEWYMERGLLQHDRVPVIFPNGKETWFKGVGERSFPTANGGELYRYHLSPSFGILRDGTGPSAIFLRNQVYLTDSNGVSLGRQKIVSRRKHLCRNWFNYEWCARILGIAQLLAGEDNKIRFGPSGEQQLIIDAKPVSLDAPRSIYDNFVDEPDETYTAWHEEETPAGATGPLR